MLWVKKTFSPNLTLQCMANKGKEKLNMMATRKVEKFLWPIRNREI
jgi:hypothetical protein